MATLLMPRATAVWLIENTTLTFEQIADFCSLHSVEVQALADGDVDSGLQSLNPLNNNQLDISEIKRCEADPEARLRMAENDLPDVEKLTKRRSTYVPIAKRAEKPDAIAWCVVNHPEFNDAQIRKLVGTTNNTIRQIRDRSYWNIANLQPRSPSELGLCSYSDLHQEIEIGQKRSEAKQAAMDKESHKMDT